MVFDETEVIVVGEASGERGREWVVVVVFFFNDTATTEIYTLSLHDALPICFITPKVQMNWYSSISPRLLMSEIPWSM